MQGVNFSCLPSGRQFLAAVWTAATCQATRRAPQGMNAH